MARLYKCYGNSCEQEGCKWELKDLTKEGGKNYCDKCLRQLRVDQEGRKILFDTISQIYGIPFPTGQMLRQIKEYRRMRNYEYENIAKAIIYSKLILKKNMDAKYGLGLIPYVIDEAVKYYDEQKRRIENMKGKNLTKETTKKIVKVSKFNKTENRENKMLSMEDI